MSTLAPPFQLLELNIISAQDLAPVSKSIKAYAVAWLNPERKLTTQIDPHGHTNPTWNERFVFRVDDDFLNADDSAIMIEIYASAWLRDVLIGTVGLLVANLLHRSNTRKSNVSFVPLQIRRPSGRPQGILNIGLNLVDPTMRSMPGYSELSHESNQKLPPPYRNNDDPSCKLLTLQRSQSEKNDSTISDYEGDEGGSGIGMPITKKGVVMNLNGSLCSDVGPSPSVVAAAIAKGLYPLPLTGAEGPNKMIDKWRSTEQGGLPRHNQKKLRHIPKGKGQNQKGGDGNAGLFSCFGTAMGCEFSITCGGVKGKGNKKKRYDGRSKAHPTAASELTCDESYI